MNATAQASASSLSGSKLDNRRILAALVDLAVVAAGGAAILVAAGVLGGGGASLGAPLAGVVVCWALYYYFACESGGGQTLGKRLTGLRVVRADGRAAGMKEIAGRTVLRVVDTALVGLIAMLATGERRARLGDLAAGTMIVPAKAPSAPAPAAAPETHPSGPVEEPEEVAAAEPVVEVEPVVEAEPAVEVSVADIPPRAEPVSGRPESAIDEHALADVHALDIASPSLRELAQDLPPATEGEAGAAADPAPEAAPDPAPEAEPVAEVEVAGPEVSVRSVETVSAIDLIMGADEPRQDPPAGYERPAGA